MANDAQGSKPSDHWSRLWEMVVSTLQDYVVNVRWKGEEDGVAAVRGLIRRGPLYWPGLAVLLFAVIAAAYLSQEGQRFAAVSTVYVQETVQIPVPTLYLSLLTAALGWAYLLIGALATGLGVYCLVAAYVTYCGGMLGAGWGPHPWFGLIPVWLLALGGWGAATHRTRWRPAFLLLLSLIAALNSYPLLRSQILPSPWALLLVTAIYFALVANRWVAGQRPIRPSLAFVVTLILFSSLYVTSLRSAPTDQFSPYVVFVFQYLLYFLEIFWFWMGTQLIETGRTLARWTLARIEAAVPRRVLVPVLAALSLGWSIVLTILTYTYELESSPLASSPGWQGALLQTYLAMKPSLALVEASNYHAFVNTAILIYVAVLIRNKKYSHEKMLQLVGISLLAFFLTYGYFGAFYSLSGATEALSGLQPLLLFVALMLWEIIKAAADLATGSGDRVGLLLGCLLIVASISLFELAADASYFAVLLTATPFLGAVYVGLPYLLYTLLYEQRRYTPVPAHQLRRAFLLGMVSAIPSLATGYIFFAPALWLLMTLATVWRHGRWEQLWDGLTYLLATGLGFAVYYAYPLFVPIPTFATFLNNLALLELRYTAQRALPWDPLFWKTMVGVMGAAAVLGYLISHAHQSQGRRRAILLLLGTLLSVALLAVWEHALAL